jgi:uncharacterized protein with von Willebrand factor type A (vWA) domain
VSAGSAAHLVGHRVGHAAAHTVGHSAGHTVGRLVENIAHFARVLRRSGVGVGPERVLAAVAALECVGLDRRTDVHAALSAVMLQRHEQQPVFDAAFDAFWRDPKLLERLMFLLLPKGAGRGEKISPKRSNRLEEALAAQRPPPAAPAPDTPAPEPVPFEATFTWSDRERLQRAEFETMTVAEFDAARRLAERLPPPVRPVPLRRRKAAPRGRIDLRATLRSMARTPHVLSPRFTQPRRERPPVVVLLDISGSMDRYARLFLHYLHGLLRRHQRLQVFTFGTRLTPITRHLRHRDPDEALAATAAHVADWRGGTRIASSLAEFNRHWARRVLTRNAALLLVSDGLDRDEQGGLSQAAAQLGRLAHEFVWLNPLLRFEHFEPRAAGVRALLPHVDRFLPVHNLASLQSLGHELARQIGPGAGRGRAAGPWPCHLPRHGPRRAAGRPAPPHPLFDTSTPAPWNSPATA